MRKLIAALVAAGCYLCLGTAMADSHAGDGEEANVAAPVEAFSCRYNEGKGPADLDKATKDFNDWADKQGIDDYSAWTLVPHYFSANQEFDVLWLGASPKAKALGRIQDMWRTTGSEAAQGFAEVITCDGHSAFAALQMKQPPERDDPSTLVVSFSDCNTADGVTFDDLVPSMMEWAKYREGHGSTAGMWVMFPAYGGGGEEFDFKWVAAWQNLAEQGADYDQYSETGWEKGNELFQGKVSCDSSRVYLATNRRMAESSDD